MFPRQPRSGYHDLVMGFCCARASRRVWHRRRTRRIPWSAWFPPASAWRRPRIDAPHRARGRRYRPLRERTPLSRTAIAWRRGETSPALAAFLDVARSRRKASKLGSRRVLEKIFGGRMAHPARIAAALCMLAASGALQAQGFPSKPVRVIIPSSPAARRTSSGARSRRSSGIPRPAGRGREQAGANGAIAAEFVARRSPTVTRSWSARSACSRSTRRCSRTCATRRAISRRSRSRSPRRNVLITRPDLPAGSMKDLVQFAKKNPGKLSYCSSGTGSSDI